MNNNRSMDRWIFFILCLCPVSAMAVITIQPNESNGILTNDSFRNESIFSFQYAMSVGDFNGDGLDDVAIKMFTLPYPPPKQVSIEIFFAPFGKGEKFSTKAHCTFIGAGISVDIPSQKMADLNGDGRDDLAVYWHDPTSGLDQIQIVFGEENPPATIDLDQGDPALRILGAPGVVFGYKITAGDFNGDTVDDYAILASSISEGSSLVYFLLGGASLPSGVVDLSIQNPFVRLMVGEGGSLVTGNFDGDQCDDLAIGAYRAPGINDVFVFRGRGPFPSPGEILTTDVQIISHYIELGVYQSYISPVSAGDITGDHRDELVLFGSVNQPNLWILSGSDISSGRPILRQQTGLPESAIFYPLPKNRDFSMGRDSSIIANFDGDGAKDLFSFNNSGVDGLLTTEIHPGGIPLENLDITSLVFVGGYELLNDGDFNGDGFQDLVGYENLNDLFPPYFSPYGELRFLYGFRPLKNPTITAPGETSESLRVTVSLSVDGNPTDMFFTGDVTAEFKDKWIPFRSSQELVLTPGGGPKTVRVRFRNAVGRESETVETAVTVRVEETRVLTETNRLRPGGRVSFDCHLQSAGVLRVRVYGPQGNEVIELENRQAESGIYPVQWDGRNVHGNRVARGVYFLVIEADGERTKKEILVE